VEKKIVSIRKESHTGHQTCAIWNHPNLALSISFSDHLNLLSRKILDLKFWVNA